MSLMKFLSAGRSFVGWKQTAPYTVVKESYLHCLGPNGFGGDQRQAALPLVTPTATPVHSERVQALAQATIAAVNEKHRPAQPLNAAAAVPSRPGLWMRLVCFVLRRNVIRNEKRGPVQSELRLGSVRVVRNDLNDADVEVVMAKPVTVATETAAPSAEITAGPKPAPVLIKTRKSKNPFQAPVENAASEQAELVPVAKGEGSLWGELSAKVFTQDKSET